MSGQNELEKLLGSFLPKSAAPGLREKILRAAAQEATAHRILTPGWRWALAASFILLALFVIFDWRASSAEQARLSRLLSASASEMVQAQKSLERQAADILAGLPDLGPDSQKLLRDVLLREERAAFRSRESARRLEEEINEY
jgi:hypothetical protein